MPRKPATTPEEKEKQMVSLAFELAERRMRDGTASAQEIVHFLKIGSSKEELERDALKADVALKRARVDNIAMAETQTEMYAEAIEAMRKYQGQVILEDD